MIRFDSRIAAGVGVALGAGYMIISLATQRSARSEPPPDLTVAASEAAVDVWKTAALLLEGTPSTIVVDVRDADEFALYHLPGAVSEPGAGGSRLAELGRGQTQVIVVAAKDETAQKLAAEARAAGSGQARIHYLAGGARAWYVAFDLPVSLFSEAAAPSGYADALALVRQLLAKPGRERSQAGVEAIQTLVKLNYQPSLLNNSAKPKAAGAPKKKISGGCG
jgi:rhodanese-related sulfurtransferase